MGRFSKIIRIILLVGVVMLAHLVGSGKAQEMLSRGKGMFVARCPEMTLERMAEKFFAPPRWEERLGPGGLAMVTVWGQLQYPNPEGVYARLWYELHPEQGLIFRSIDFSGIVQQEWIYYSRLEKICGEAR